MQVILKGLRVWIRKIWWVKFSQLPKRFLLTPPPSQVCSGWAEGLRRGLRRTSGVMHSPALFFVGVFKCSTYSFNETPYLERETQNSSFSLASWGTVFFSNLYSYKINAEKNILLVNKNYIARIKQNNTNMDIWIHLYLQSLLWNTGCSCSRF